jgi:hypothetical protein
MTTLEVEKILSTKNFIGFPEELDKEYSEEEFRKMMTSHNSDIPIEKVSFLDYPDNNTE